MAELLLKDYGKKLAEAREKCPGMSEDMYLLTDYLAQVEFSHDIINPTGVLMMLSCVMDDIEKGRCGFSKEIEYPKKMRVRRDYILAQIPYFPQVIDAIAEEAFAEEVRKQFKEVFHNEPPKRYTVNVEEDMPEFVRVAAKWWAEQLASPKMDNGEPQLATLMAMFGMTAKQHDSEKVTAFANELAKGIVEKIGGGHICTISVDYDPDWMLRQAAERAGLEVGIYAFPFKTTMRITEDSVTVSCGYGAKWETLWQKSKTV